MYAVGKKKKKILKGRILIYRYQLLTVKAAQSLSDMVLL
jgi:hypothetical protein